MAQIDLFFKNSSTETVGPRQETATIHMRGVGGGRGGGGDTCNFNFLWHSRERHRMRKQHKHKHNTTAILNASNLLSYFPLVESTSKPKKYCLFCLLGKAGVIHRHPDPKEVQPKLHFTQIAVSLPSPPPQPNGQATAWCYTEKQHKKI